ncbi:MAG: GNAT family N-acetyltransferase [Candidatus Sericytochromatia bacterium]|uniref:GNAT family N-acetyltransferase n=1 Tax=Candidatus Tanganyikabacteria bacterium TaxID=2961651 RepID=A0A937X5N5_9BACT|nr:GNAT family N-acetyltransferase [Candidatus Tanganyikabacteria bacterium]
MLRGPNVHLRPLEREDLPLLVEWRNDPAAWKFFCNPHPLSLGGQAAFYDRLQANPYRRLFIIATPQGEAIGTIGLDDIDPVNQSAEFGNLLIGEKAALGKGFAKEATELLIDYAFKRLNVQRLYLNVHADNDRAIKLYEKCMFEHEGRKRRALFRDGVFIDVLMMSRLR